MRPEPVPMFRPIQIVLVAGAAVTLACWMLLPELPAPDGLPWRVDNPRENIELAGLPLRESLRSAAATIEDPPDHPLSGALAGRLLLGNGLPLADIEVRFERTSSDAAEDSDLGAGNEEGEARTDAQGRFRVSGLMPGRYSVRVLNEEDTWIQTMPPTVPAGSAEHDLLVQRLRVRVGRADGKSDSIGNLDLQGWSAADADL